MDRTIANAQPDPSTRDRAAREIAASRYDRCHPNDSFADLARRARFSKEDRRLMEDWLDAAARQQKKAAIAADLTPVALDERDGPA